MKSCLALVLGVLSIVVVADSFTWECSKVGEWYKDPYNECTYYQCDGKIKFRRPCAPGVSVPVDYVDGSSTSPCSKQSTEECAPCKFPKHIRHPVRWWYGQENNKDVVMTFDNFRVSYALASDPDTPTHTETCTGHTDKNDKVYYTRSLTLDNRTEACVEQTDVKFNHFIFRKTKEKVADTSTALDCFQSILPAVTTYDIFVKDPLATNLVGKSCPLPNGQYFTTYSAGSGEKDMCIGDSNSVADVNGDTITFNTCGAGDTQKNPYKAKLTCLDTFTPGSVWDEGTSSNGDILLLANENRDRFYCARYHVDGKTLLLSLDVTPDTTKLTCRTGVDYLHFVDDNVTQFRAFRISDTLMTTTTSTTTTTTTTTSTTTTTTTPPPTTRPTIATTTTKAPTTTTTSTTAIKPLSTTTKAAAATTSVTKTPTTTTPKPTKPTTTINPTTATTVTKTPTTTTNVIKAPKTTTTTTTTTTTVTPSPTRKTSTPKMGQYLVALQKDVIVHVEFGFARRYEIYVGDDESLFADVMRSQIAQQMNVNVDRIKEVQIYKGSIIVRFTILPPDGAGVSSADAVATLMSSVKSGTLDMTVPDGSKITATPIWFYWWTEERDCPDGVCQNGGNCIVQDWQMMCLCTQGFRGTYCNVSSLHLSSEFVREITIFIGVLSGSILIVTLLAVAICRTRTNDYAVKRWQPDEIYYNNKNDYSFEEPMRNGTSSVIKQRLPSDTSDYSSSAPLNVAPIGNGASSTGTQLLPPDREQPATAKVNSGVTLVNVTPSPITSAYRHSRTDVTIESVQNGSTVVAIPEEEPVVRDSATYKVDVAVTDPEHETTEEHPTPEETYAVVNKRAPDNNVDDDDHTPEDNVDDNDNEALERNVDDDNQPPGNNADDDNQTPEDNVGDDNQTPEDNVDDDNQTPEDNVDDENQTPEDNVDDDNQTPEDNVDDENQTPEDNVDDENQTPEDNVDDDNQTPEDNSDDDDQTSNDNADDN